MPCSVVVSLEHSARHGWKSIRTMDSLSVVFRFFRNRCLQEHALKSTVDSVLFAVPCALILGEITTEPFEVVEAVPSTMVHTATKSCPGSNPNPFSSALHTNLNLTLVPSDFSRQMDCIPKPLRRKHVGRRHSCPLSDILHPSRNSSH